MFPRLWDPFSFIFFFGVWCLKSVDFHWLTLVPIARPLVSLGMSYLLNITGLWWCTRVLILAVIPCATCVVLCHFSASFFCLLVTAIWHKNKNVPTPEICKIRNTSCKTSASRLRLPGEMCKISLWCCGCSSCSVGKLFFIHSTRRHTAFHVLLQSSYRERQFVTVTHRKFGCKTKNAAIHKWILNCRWCVLRCKVILRSLVATEATVSDSIMNQIGAYTEGCESKKELCKQYFGLCLHISPFYSHQSFTNHQLGCVTLTHYNICVQHEQAGITLGCTSSPWVL